MIEGIEITKKKEKDKKKKKKETKTRGARLKTHFGPLVIMKTAKMEIVTPLIHGRSNLTRRTGKVAERMNLSINQYNRNEKMAPPARRKGWE